MTAKSRSIIETENDDKDELLSGQEYGNIMDVTEQLYYAVKLIVELLPHVDQEQQGWIREYFPDFVRVLRDNPSDVPPDEIAELGLGPGPEE